ncbi:MAG TPA: metallophosphoesterase, partial [Fibrobacteraceae bacterium]|nr:metallophosphoesterase [Fibrobacteraceae bacterium]
MTQFNLRLRLLISTIICLGCVLQAETWKFGLVGDLHGSSGTGRKVNGIDTVYLHDVNQAFINQGVKLVLQSGDFSDNSDTAAINTLSRGVQFLYDNGIAFFPVRGNHNENSTTVSDFRKAFPQTQGGSMYATSSSAFNLGSDFTSPETSLAGLTYGFHYRNASFVIIDPYATATGSEVSVTDQRDWVDSVLHARDKDTTHAFVMAHPGLIPAYHLDAALFGDLKTNANLLSTDTFVTVLDTNDVGYYFCGHDHEFQYSLVRNLDSSRTVRQVIDVATSQRNDEQDGSYTRKVKFAKEGNISGFFVGAVDSTRITLNFYHGENAAETWSWAYRMGYDLSGNKFLISKGADYTSVKDTSQGDSPTYAAILDGELPSSSSYRQQVNTGWSYADSVSGQASRIFTLWGMEPSVGSDTTNTFVISLTYDDETSKAKLVKNRIGLLASDSSGDWSPAIQRNSRTGSDTGFVVRAYDSSSDG